MSWLNKDGLRLLIVLLPFIFLVIFWTDLPAQIPLPWNLNGEPDGSGSKFILIGLAAINPVIFALFLLLPHLDPQRRKNLFFQDKGHILQLIIHLFLTYGFMLVAFIALGYQLQANLIIKYGLIGLFLVIGNYLGTVHKNYLIGFKTPWTLNSDYVWRKTHRFAATWWVMSSVFMLLYNFWEKTYPWAFYVYVGLLALVPVFYSYLVYKNQPEVPATPPEE